MFSVVPSLLQGTLWTKKLGGWIFLFYSQICHQMSDRSFSFCGFSMAVCARCAGIYYGSFLGIVIFPFIARFNYYFESKFRLMYGIALIPIVFDFCLTKLGLFQSSNIIRHITGLFSGFIVSIILLIFIFYIPNKEVD